MARQGSGDRSGAGTLGRGRRQYDPAVQPGAEQSRRRAGLTALALILLAGVGLRVGYAWNPYEPQVLDARAYARIARSVDEDGSFSQRGDFTPAEVQPASNYSPGLPLAVGGLYRLTGGVDERLARVVLALVASLSVLFSYMIGLRLSGPAAGLIAAAAVAVYPAFLEYGGMLMTEPLAAALLSGSVLAMLWAAERSGIGRWLLPGLLLGATAMVRPEYLAIAALLSLVVFARGARRSPGPALRQAGVLLAGVLIVVAPWAVRNLIVLDRFVPISTGGGQVLFAGTYLPSGGDPLKVGQEVLERHPAVRRALLSEHLPPAGSGASPQLLLSQLRPPASGGPRQALSQRVSGPEPPTLERILAALAAERYPGLQSDVALARMGKDQLWRDISEEPARYAGFLVDKLSLMWLHGPRGVMHEPAWALLHFLLIGFGLAGLLVLAAKRRWEALILATILVAITLVGLVLVASPRRVLVAIPLVAPLAGVGAVWVFELVRRRFPEPRIEARSSS
jgi:4-amino-4-deoxy-L-arabinose transferase-like glycosyltransferase